MEPLWVLVCKHTAFKVAPPHLLSSTSREGERERAAMVERAIG